MPSFVQSPRRAPRVRVRLPVELGWGSANWRGTMVDVSASGCAVLTERQVPAGTRISIAVRREAPVAPLAVEAEVVWYRGTRLAASFSRTLGKVDLGQWMDALQHVDPSVRGAADRLPQQTDARLDVRRDLPLGAAIGSDEAAILHAAAGGRSVGLTALHARLPPDRFARALFSLLGKGIVICPALEGSLPRGESSLDQLAQSLMRPSAPAPAAGPAREPSGRGALRVDWLAADLTVGAKNR